MRRRFAACSRIFTNEHARIIGTETRTVVSGISQFYKPEEMVGKNVILLANLEPRKLKGIESQGMILAAEKDGVLGLLTTDKKVGNGSAVE